MLLLFFEQIVDLSHEFRDILEFEVDGGKSEIGYLVNAPQFRKENLSDAIGFQFAIRAFLNGLFYFVDYLLKLRQTDGSLFTCFKKSVQNFVPIESLSAAVFFYHHIGDFVAALIARKPTRAIQALAAAPNGISVPALPRINNTIF